MYDELTAVDIKKMKEELDHRVRALRPQLIEEVQTARQAGEEPERQPHPVSGADDPHGEGD